MSSGTAGTLGTFTEPTSGPTAGTMHTLNDIMGKAPVVDVNGATAGDVLAGKTYWGLTSGGWGPRTGTVTAGANVTGADGAKTITIPDGLYSGSKTATANDANLVVGNIKSGVSIFGVVGTVVQATGDAGAGDVLTGKTFSNSVANNQNGSMANNGTGSTIDPGIADQTLAAGYWASGNTVKGDTYLAAGNIKSGVSIFGVAGTLQSVTDRYLDLGNGTVRDQETGLMWTKNANHGSMDWAAAVAYCNNMNAGSGTYGYTDWRLPSVKQQDGPGGPMGKPELDTLGRPGGIPGATPYSMPGAPFTGVQSAPYWSSTTLAGNTVYAWYVYLPNGYVYVVIKTFTYYVWPVRGGQP